MAHIREKPSPMFMNSGRRLPPRMRLPSTLEDKKHTQKRPNPKNGDFSESGSLNGTHFGGKSNLMQMFGNFTGFPVKK